MNYQNVREGRMRTADDIIRLAKIAASKCFINDPAIGREDLIQAAVVSLLRFPELPNALAVMRARSSIGDLRRSNQVKRRQEQETLSPNFTIPDRRDQVSSIAEDEERDVVRNSGCLTPQQRLIVGLLLDGWTQAEISGRIGISLSGVANQVTSAVRRLRRHFGLPNIGLVRMGRGRASVFNA